MQTEIRIPRVFLIVQKDWKEIGPSHAIFTQRHPIKLQRYLFSRIVEKFSNYNFEDNYSPHIPQSKSFQVMPLGHIMLLWKGWTCKLWWGLIGSEIEISCYLLSVESDRAPSLSLPKSSFPQTYLIEIVRQPHNTNYGMRNTLHTLLRVHDIQSKFQILKFSLRNTVKPQWDFTQDR